MPLDLGLLVDKGLLVAAVVVREQPFIRFGW